MYSMWYVMVSVCHMPVLSVSTDAECVCVGCSPEFRFNNHLERTVPLDDDQPKKMLLKRDPDSSEVRDKCSTERPSECSVLVHP